MSSTVKTSVDTVVHNCFDRNVDKACDYTRFALRPNIASIPLVENCQSKQHNFPATPPNEYLVHQHYSKLLVVAVAR